MSDASTYLDNFRCPWQLAASYREADCTIAAGADRREVFDAAVDVARAYFHAMGPSADRHGDMARYRGELLFLYYRGEVDLLGLATTSIAAFEIIADLSAEAIAVGAPVEPAWREFVSEVLRGERVRPKETSSSRAMVWRNREWAAQATRLIVQTFGLRYTRNDASQKHSASDAVAAAAGQFGLRLRYSTICDAYRKRFEGDRSFASKL